MRGDVHVLKPQRGALGHEQQGIRLAVVVQSDAFHLSTLVIAPTSTSGMESELRPVIQVNGRQTRVLTDGIRSVDPERIGPRVGALTVDELREVDSALKTLLALR